MLGCHILEISSMVAHSPDPAAQIPVGLHGLIRTSTNPLSDCRLVQCGAVQQCRWSTLILCRGKNAQFRFRLGAIPRWVARLHIDDVKVQAARRSTRSSSTDSTRRSCNRHANQNNPRQFLGRCFFAQIACGSVAYGVGYHAAISALSRSTQERADETGHSGLRGMGITQTTAGLPECENGRACRHSVAKVSPIQLLAVSGNPPGPRVGSNVNELKGHNPSRARPPRTGAWGLESCRMCPKWIC